MDFMSLAVTPLHVACKWDHPDSVETLLQYGTDVDVRDQDGGTALHDAARCGSTQCAIRLLDHGADIDSRDIFLQTPFMIACQSAHFDVVELLWKQGINRHDADYDGSTALHLATYGSSPRVFGRLLELGFDATKKNSAGFTPFDLGMQRESFSAYMHMRGFVCNVPVLHAMFERDQYAPWLYNGRSDLHRLLKKLPNTGFYSPRNLQTNHVAQPLCTATMHGYLPGMKALIIMGVDLELEHPIFGTALAAACLAGNLDSVKFLVRYKLLLKSESCCTIRCAHYPRSVLRWLLIERHTEQPKLKISVETEGQEVKAWSGVQHIQVPIYGVFVRGNGQSLVDHVCALQSYKKGTADWRRLVPLVWESGSPVD